MSNKQEEKTRKVVYGVTVKVGDTSVFKVIAADNRHQAATIATKGMIEVRPMSPFEVLSHAEEEAKRARERAAEILASTTDEVEQMDPEIVAAVGGLPAGDRT